MNVGEALALLKKYPKESELIIAVNSTSTGLEECLSQLNVPIESIIQRGDGRVSMTSPMIQRNVTSGDESEHIDPST